MDVRCAQCQAEYELDDTLVAERGTAVCCTRCGFRFRAYRRAGSAAAPERWVVRTAGGSTLTFLSLRELQEAIVLRRVGPQDALTRGLGPARSLASIVEFRSLFEAAKRGGEGLPKMRPSMPTPAGLGSPSRPSLPLGLVPHVDAAGPGGGPVRPSSPGVGVAQAAEAARSESVAIPAEVSPPNLETPPTGLVVPRASPSAPTEPGGASSGRPSSLPSLIQTIPFGEDMKGPIREAIEAARAGLGRGPAGRTSQPADAPRPRPSILPGEITAPLFTGVGPSAGPQLGPGGTLITASTPHAFAAPGAMTPPEGYARPSSPGGDRGSGCWASGRPSGAPAEWPGGAGAPAEWPGGAGAPAGARRAGELETPWAAPRLAAPKLRWFFAAALAIALGGGLALSRLGAFEQGPAAPSARPEGAPIDALVASAEGALGRGDVDGALAAYAQAKALGGGDARVAIGGAKAAVLRAEGPWWRLRWLPSEAGSAARSAAVGELAEAAGRAVAAVDEAQRVAPDEGRARALRLDALRLSGELPAARELAPSVRAAAASSADAAYAWAALRLAEGAPVDDETLARLREAAAGEAAPGRASAALAYALLLAGDGRAARAELDRLAAAPKPFGALPELRAWLDARSASAVATAGPRPTTPAAAAPRAPAPRRRPLPRATFAPSPAPPGARETGAIAPTPTAPVPTAAGPVEGGAGPEAGGAAGAPALPRPAAPAVVAPKPAGDADPLDERPDTL